MIKLLEDGEIPSSILKQANKMIELNVKSPSDVITFFKDFSKMIPNTYYEMENDENKKERIQKEIILSELFMN